MDISRKTNLAHTSVKKNLADLIKEGFIRQESQKKGKRECQQLPSKNEKVNNKDEAKLQ